MFGIPRVGQLQELFLVDDVLDEAPRQLFEDHEALFWVRSRLAINMVVADGRTTRIHRLLTASWWEQRVLPIIGESLH